MEHFKTEIVATKYFDYDSRKLKRVETKINGEVIKLEWFQYSGTEQRNGKPYRTWSGVKNKKELEAYYKKWVK